MKKTRYLLCSIIALLVPAYFIVTWAYVTSTTSGGQYVLRQRYFTFLPSFLQNSYYLIFFAIFCCLLAFLLSFKTLPAANKWFQAVALGIMGIATLLITWLILSLM